MAQGSLQQTSCFPEGYIISSVESNILHQNHAGSLLKHGLLNHTLRVSDLVDWGWGLRVCISNISQVMLMLLVWDHSLRNIALIYLPSYSFLCTSFVILMLKSPYPAEKVILYGPLSAPPPQGSHLKMRSSLDCLILRKSDLVRGSMSVDPKQGGVPFFS